jgi:hypothetical protein
MRRLAPLLLIGLFLMPPSRIFAQRVTVDFRGAAASPQERLAGIDLKAGSGFGTTLALKVRPHLFTYAGWDWMRFRTDAVPAASRMDFIETGYTLGLRFEHPFRVGSDLAYRLELGGTSKHIEVENDVGELIADSGHEIGFESGASLVMPFGKTWRLIPTARYRSLGVGLTMNDASSKGHHRYYGIEVAVAREF